MHSVLIKCFKIGKSIRLSGHLRLRISACVGSINAYVCKDFRTDFVYWSVLLLFCFLVSIDYPRLHFCSKFFFSTKEVEITKSTAKLVKHEPRDDSRCLLLYKGLFIYEIYFVQNIYMLLILN